MSDILDIIKHRRSIRKYTKKLPKDTDIERLLEAARWAPSGLNNQPWRFSW
ncbi:MAG: nitroreductase family protein [Candidatus Omnitrophota bacterium]